MVEFLVTFAALVAGPQPVAVRVGPEVASVEFRLDDAPAAEIAGPPWQAVVDLGPDLLRHELVAVARDGQGGELGRAQLQINGPAGPESSEAGTASPAAGGAGLVIVEDPACETALRALGGDRDRLGNQGFGPDVRVVVLGTRATEVRPSANATYTLFAVSPPNAGGDHGLSWLLSRVAPPPAPERVADAVAVAGSLAAAAEAPRAVLLVVGEAIADSSLFSPPEVVRYLAALGVPLFVWTPAADPGPLSAAWGEVDTVATLEQFAAAANRLREALDTQRAQPEPGASGAAR